MVRHEHGWGWLYPALEKAMLCIMAAFKDTKSRMTE
jgi:hypothetical protein